MADQLLDRDFEGQRLCDSLATILLSAVAAIAFLVGYVLQDIKLSLFIALGGTALTFLVVLPAWPFFNKNPVKWLPAGGQPSNISIPQTVVLDEK
ncbi:microsomal signal peptidase [Grosmannia clavigera kw1407]|uniref:Signal peptidase complex subunit 1 n=1 Tax=Grosmannia clavigera (strain kw1407 / UAMH 11150) TaxID=655863 RepID=F0XPQ2_GROCL|nr:microsomal signal peptidase [Grosmannia clavigera kw1407]EFX00141.1 microsomal signal peptidase [Grosmannia clavigera kw1407]